MKPTEKQTNYSEFTIVYKKKQIKDPCQVLVPGIMKKGPDSKGRKNRLCFLCQNPEFHYICNPYKTAMSNNVKIFSGSASHYLAEKIAKCYGQDLGKVALLRFSDGEFQTSYEETVRGSDVFIIQSTFPPTDNLFELLLMIDAAKRASANQIIAVLPYFGYARQDRKDQPRVAIGAKMVANLLSAAGATRIITMDLHADQIQGFF